MNEFFLKYIYKLVSSRYSYSSNAINTLNVVHLSLKSACNTIDTKGISE